MRLLWLDDARDPNDTDYGDWLIFAAVPRIQITEVIWVKSFHDFIIWIHYNGLPDTICFDHDLGEGKTGYDCAKWLVDYCIKTKKDLPSWSIHSANPVGKENIEFYLKSYTKSKNHELNKS